MYVSDVIQLPSEFYSIEEYYFTEEESDDLIYIYNIMDDDNCSRSQKISSIKNLLQMFDSYNKDGKKILALLIYSVLNTKFGHALIQSNEKFRETVFQKYEALLIDGIDDQLFIQELKNRKI
jgi:hypothetical protein